MGMSTDIVLAGKRLAIFLDKGTYTPTNNQKLRFKDLAMEKQFGEFTTGIVAWVGSERDVRPAGCHEVEEA